MKLLKIIYLVLFLSLVSTYAVSAQTSKSGGNEQAYKVLKGTIGRKDYHTYVQVPFTLPDGVKRLSVEFSYDKKEERTTIDLGLMDPQGKIRGWSGGARNKFTISKVDASPGYMAGPVDSGRWALLLGIPNIREGVIANYEAKIFIETQTGITEFYDRPIRTEAGWYRGDLHMHSGNSDGNIVSQSGKNVPSPVYRVVEFAAKEGLDFIALTDHNATTQAEELLELQPAFDKMLFVPGEEITTFYGHANVFGLTEPMDFRTTLPTYREAKKWMDAARRAGGIISINHPGIPSGENCMGCGWQIDSIPSGVITSLEVVNGGSLRFGAESPIQGWDLWHKMLKSGQHITAIGGSDDHHAGEKNDLPGSIGNPTTVIFMNELSVKGVLDGIRRGRVFVDVEGNKNRFLDFSASEGKDTAAMGSTLNISTSGRINLNVEVRGVSGGKIEFIIDGETIPELSRAIPSDKENISTRWKADAGNHFIYVKVRDNKGKLVLFSNPVYIRGKR